MDVREKLVKLVEYMDGVCPSGVSCYNCPHKDIGEGCSIQAKVDYLIKGGVTVQDNTEITDELLKQLRNAPITVLHEEPTIEVMQEWISVKDRLPDFDGKYLVARAEGDRYSISVRKFRKEVPCWYTGYCGHWERRTNGITHWQTLPEPPTNK